MKCNSRTEDEFVTREELAEGLMSNALKSRLLVSAVRSDKKTTGAIQRGTTR
jgi:hypothetical protein